MAGKGTTPADAYLDGTAFEFESRSCFVISKDSKPRRWIIQLIKWPYPFKNATYISGFTKFESLFSISIRQSKLQGLRSLKG